MRMAGVQADAVLPLLPLVASILSNSSSFDIRRVSQQSLNLQFMNFLEGRGKHALSQPRGHVHGNAYVVWESTRKLRRPCCTWR